MSDSEHEYRTLCDSGGVDLWQGVTVAPPNPAELRPLSPAERGVMLRVPRAEGARYATAHIAVRRVLARYLGVPPAGIRFSTSPCPSCAGADVEDGRSGSAAGAASPVLSEAETPCPNSLSDSRARHATFPGRSTRKEANVKAIGTGSTVGLKVPGVRTEPDGPLVGPGAEAGGGGPLVRDVPGGGDLFVALAGPADRTGAGPRGPAPSHRTGRLSTSLLVPFRS